MGHPACGRLADKEMIKLDLSKTVPPRLGSYFLALIPGVFFESSLAIGNPHFAAAVIARAREIYAFGPYALLFLFLASGLFIGEGFFLRAWIAYLLIASAFVLWRYAIRITFGSQWLYRRLATLQGIPPQQTIFIRSLSKLIFWARQREFSIKARPVVTCLHIATEQLLKKRYGIEMASNMHSDGSEWGVWFSSVGEPPKWFSEGRMAARTMLGCGLAGFAALYASPLLRDRYFIVLCSLFAFAGLFVTFDLALWSFNPVRRTLLNLRSVLLELSATNAMTEKENTDSDKRSSHNDDTSD
jgi:hypothetical protein